MRVSQVFLHSIVALCQEIHYRLFLTDVSILLEEVVNPRCLRLGINIWNKDGLVLSPLYAAWYAAFTAQLVNISYSKTNIMKAISDL